MNLFLKAVCELWSNFVYVVEKPCGQLHLDRGYIAFRGHIATVPEEAATMSREWSAVVRVSTDWPQCIQQGISFSGPKALWASVQTEENNASRTLASIDGLEATAEHPAGKSSVLTVTYNDNGGVKTEKCEGYIVGRICSDYRVLGPTRSTSKLHNGESIATFCLGPDSTTLGMSSSSSSNSFRLWDWSAKQRGPGSAARGHEFLLRRECEGHISTIDCLKFFPSGEVALSGGSDFMIKLWRLEDALCARTFMGHVRPVTSLAMVDRGRNFVSISLDGTVRLWECGSGECIDVVSRQSKPINCCVVAGMTPGEDHGTKEFGTGGKTVVCGSDDGHVKLFDLRSRKQVMAVKVEDAVTSVVVPSLEESSNVPPTILAGCEAGWVCTVDTRMNCNRHSMRFTTADITRLTSLSSGSTCIATADGLCGCYDDDGAMYWLSGPDAEPITGVQSTKLGNSYRVMTTSRDGYIREYILP